MQQKSNLSSYHGMAPGLNYCYLHGNTYKAKTREMVPYQRIIVNIKHLIVILLQNQVHQAADGKVDQERNL